MADEEKVEGSGRIQGTPDAKKLVMVSRIRKNAHPSLAGLITAGVVSRAGAPFFDDRVARDAFRSRETRSREFSGSKMGLAAK